MFFKYFLNKYYFFGTSIEGPKNGKDFREKYPSQPI